MMRAHRSKEKFRAITIKKVSSDVADFINEIPYGMRARTITALLLAARTFANAYGTHWYAEVISGRIAVVSDATIKITPGLPRYESRRTARIHARAKD